ncbi:MAG TPA: AbrB/MazE/SpoVT family DNA-binding domain-containing protein [Gemmatimonadota bacterium]|nr:AbrB/MazE/SpoVT family DNA-binding domain-containing protein [Gemmatimonadota bacterium]
MSRVTSKLQVTIPKRIADQYGIRPGDEIAWVPAGETIRVVPAGRETADVADVARRLDLFDQATARHERRREAAPPEPAADRGWTREDLYDRGRPR